MRRQQGSVLVIALVLLFVMALLIINQLDIAGLDIKMASNRLQHLQAFALAEQSLKQAEINLIVASEPKCIYGKQSNDYFIHQSPQWWHTHGCASEIYQSFKSFYVVERQSETPCRKFYRISSFAEEQQQQAVVLLQSTLAVVTNKMSQCSKSLKTGRLSWRYIG